MPADDSPPASSSAPAESILWSGHTSQWVHFWFYFFCVLLAAGIVVAGTLSLIAGGALLYAALVVPAVMWLVRWWVTKCTTYELTSQRLRIRTGVFSRRVDELELYRVKDYAMEQPFLLRLVGLGNLTMITSDATHSQISMLAIPDVESVREKLRAAVQTERDRKRVRELDVDSHDDGATLS